MIASDFSYESRECPPEYACSCGAAGVRLYRQYGTFADHTDLKCRQCSLLEQKREHPDSESEVSIGWRVAAVPVEDGPAFWVQMA